VTIKGEHETRAICLDSWKAIANYLHRDVRTVQRWETLEGLPIHRHLHRAGASVFALQDELDTWRRVRCDRKSELTHASKKAVRTPATETLTTVLLALLSALTTHQDSSVQSCSEAPLTDESLGGLPDAVQTTITTVVSSHIS